MENGRSLIRIGSRLQQLIGDSKMGGVANRHQKRRSLPPVRIRALRVRQITHRRELRLCLPRNLARVVLKVRE